MPDKQITNAGGVWGMAADANAQTITCVNNSAGTLAPGDVVVFSTDTTGTLVTTTTTVNDKTVIGVVGGKTDTLSTYAAGTSYAAGATMPVVVRGPARVNVGANTPAAGDILTTSAAAKAAITNAAAPAANTITGSLIGIVRAATKDANNTVVAEIIKF